MTQAGAAVKEEVVRALIVLISNAPELHGYAVRAFYRALALHLDRAEFALVMAATWLIGGVRS
jgi:AP-1 complex subunit gamma-1